MEHPTSAAVPTTAVRYCELCGECCTELFEDAPVCATHGPRWRQTRHGVGSDVLIERDGRVLLSMRAHNPQRGKWELPGGFAAFGEHPAAAAHREAMEELGASVRLTEFFGVYMAGYGPDEAVQVTVYLADLLGEPNPDPSESLDMRWFAPGELPAPDEFAEGHWQRVDDWVAWRSGGPTARGESRFGIDP